MRTLAENTDGLAVLNTNDLDKGLNRLADDMSSYYLLGYYASNTKPDGRFRTITVRVKQPGIEVRARKGYRAPTAGELTEARAASPPVAAAPTAVQTAIDQLGKIRPGARFRIDAVVGPGPRPSMWVVGELVSSSRPDEFSQGATAAIEASGNGASTTGAATLKPGESTFVIKLDAAALGSGNIDVRVRLSPAEGSALPLSEAIRLDRGGIEARDVPAGPDHRAAPAAGRKSRSSAERSECVSTFPSGPPKVTSPATGRVLDRGGTATQITVVVSERTDEATGQRWIAADLNLAALSPGDYVVEVVYRAGIGRGAEPDAD